MTNRLRMFRRNQNHQRMSTKVPRMSCERPGYQTPLLYPSVALPFRSRSFLEVSWTRSCMAMLQPPFTRLSLNMSQLPLIRMLLMVCHES